MNHKSTKGYALVITLLIVIFFTVLILGISFMSNATSHFIGKDRNQLIAEYAAQAGAKMGMEEVYKEAWTSTFTPISRTGKVSTSDTSSSYIYNISDLITSGSDRYVYVRSVGRYISGGKTYTSPAIIRLDILQIIHNTPEIKLSDWTTGGITRGTWTDYDDGHMHYIQPSGDGGYGFPNKMEQSDSIAMNCACAEFSVYGSGHTADGAGYGVYYGFNGNPNDPEGYVVQFDPGANKNTKDGKGCLLVKFEKDRDGSDTSNGSDREFNSDKGDYYENSYDYWANPFEQDKTDNNKKNLADLIIEFDSTDPDAVESMLDKYNYTKIDLADLKRLMETKYGVQNFDIQGRHTIEVKWKEDPKLSSQVATDSRPRHVVYVDGFPVLSFIDYTRYAIINFKDTKTGLRVWNCTSQFYDVEANRQYTSNPKGHHWEKYNPYDSNHNPLPR